MTYLIWALGITAMAIGLTGAALPALPGTPLIFFGAWLIAWWGEYTIINGGTMLALAFLAAAGFVADIVASGLGAKQVGASNLALLGATIGSLVGIFFALPGMIIGPFVGACIGEYAHQRSLRKAASVGIGTWIGLLVGTALKVAIAVTMIATFAIAALA